MKFLMATNRQRLRRKGNATVISVILMIVLLAMGVIVGAVAVRDQIVQEFGDISVALDRLNQTYSVRIEIDPDGPGGIPQQTCLYGYTDPLPTLEDNGTGMMPEPPAGLTFVAPSSTESPVPNPPGTLP